MILKFFVKLITSYQNSQCVPKSVKLVKTLTYGSRNGFIFSQLLIILIVLQRNESEVEGMAVAGASSSFVGDNDSSIAAASPSNVTNPDDDGHKEGGKKKKNRCLSCKKKVGLTGNCFRTIVRFWWNLLLCELLVSKS